jgi:hypothetical protein
MFMFRIFSTVMICSLLLAVYPVAAESGLPDKISGTGPAEERVAVVRVLREYLRVTDFQDRDAIGKAFHPTAVLSKVTSGGALKLMTQDEWWERVSRIPKDTPARKSVITLVEVAEAGAVARIDITDARGNTSTDLFTLLKTAQGWRIINKVLSSPL